MDDPGEKNLRLTIKETHQEKFREKCNIALLKLPPFARTVLT
jgi:hypothetical protein